MNYLIISLLFFSAFIGGISIFFFKHDNRQRLKLVLSFSGAYLFAITILHLLPEVYASGERSVGLYILGGFILQILLEQFSDGIEHGHVHAGHSHSVSFPYGIMISLSLHAFLEGMPLNGKNDAELVYGISLHHIPAAFALGSVLMQNKIKKPNVVVCLIVFALMSPLGYIFSTELSKGSISSLSDYYQSIMGVVIGIFLHISTTILFESSVDHRFTIKKTLAVFLGIGVALLSYFLVNH